MSAGPVLYVSRFVPDYNVPALRLLNERLGGQLVVCAGQPPPGSSLESLGAAAPDQLPYLELRNYWFHGERLHVQPYSTALRRWPAPSVVLAEESPRSISLPWLLRSARRAGAGTALWGHFSSNNRWFNPNRHPFDRYRVWLARSVDACVAYTDEIASRLSEHVDPGDVFVARNALDTRELVRLYDRLAREGVSAVRRRLGLPVNEPVLAFIGRLIPEKGLRLLIETFALLRARMPVSLVVIGDGPGREFLEKHIESLSLDGIFRTGAKIRMEESAPWLYAADLALLPGYLGLSVNHAFAFGLPVVSIESTSGARLHSPEIEYVHQDLNGVLTRPEPSSLAAAVEAVLSQRDRFSRAALSFAREHLTIDRMVDGLEAAVRHAAAKARRSTPASSG